tara:strand:- start:4366 stop:4503 length:138 start_codon:yes stop_codon:yes gene_type:complete
MAYGKKRVTFYKGRKRFTKWYKSFKKAMNSKMALRKRGWKSSKLR